MHTMCHADETWKLSELLFFFLLVVVVEELIQFKMKKIYIHDEIILYRLRSCTSKESYLVISTVHKFELVKKY